MRGSGARPRREHGGVTTITREFVLAGPSTQEAAELLVAANELPTARKLALILVSRSWRPTVWRTVAQRRNATLR